MAEEFRTPQSANEAALQNWAGADNELRAPQSRIEKLLLAILGEDVTPDPPQSVNEELLTQILEQGGGGKDHTFDVPTITGTYTYDGTSQTPSISGYYSDFMTESGDTSETNAGSYSITFALKDTENCQWRDGTTENKTVAWSIAKATPSKPTISASTIRLSTTTLTDTFTVTRDGDGAITATSSDPTKVTASVSGDTVTLTLNDTTTEATVDITVTVAAGTNYLAYTATDVVCEAEIVLIPQGYIVFDSADGTSVTVGKNNGKTWDGTVEYSTDGETWSEWNGTDTITGLSVYLRGSNNTVITGNVGRSLVLNGTNIYCNGNINALLDYTSAEQGIDPTMRTGCFRELFKDCTSLISAPLLPSQSLNEYCYVAMFQNCTSLIKPPALPATILRQICYTLMFSGCTSLIALPALPALQLLSDCYANMFSGCSSIKLSTAQSEEYSNEYRVPMQGEGSGSGMTGMFGNTGGSFVGTPTINTTYYTSNEIVS